MNNANAFPARRLMILLALMLTLVAVYSGASVPTLTTDGWHAWRVNAVADAPDWCCLTWGGNAHDSAGRSCRLDAGYRGFDSGHARAAAPEEMRVYVRIEDGSPVDVRAFSVACPVSAAEGVADHGKVNADDSARWLGALVTADDGPGSEAIAALAVHAGDVATRLLRRIAADGAAFAVRKDAVFWMGQVRARAMRADLRARMFDDADAKMREHAAFSWSQSDLDDRGDALVELARRDADVRVRGQAWFWLAQTGDPQAEAAIRSALRAEESPGVREQAVFALSQLGDERGAAALIAVVEDRALAASDRERALFWLAQDPSVRALEYLARVLE